MPVKTYDVRIVQEDWDTGRSFCYSEKVKAHTLAQADEKAHNEVLEHGPDASILSVDRSVKINGGRVKNNIDRLHRRNFRPVQYAYRYDGRKRRFN